MTGRASCYLSNHLKTRIQVSKRTTEKPRKRSVNKVLYCKSQSLLANFFFEESDRLYTGQYQCRGGIEEGWGQTVSSEFPGLIEVLPSVTSSPAMVFINPLFCLP